MFMQTPNLNLLLDLINNGSDTLLFVIFSYLSKNPLLFGKNIDSLIIIIQNIASWELRGFTFVRHHKKTLEEYVTRTIMLALGVFLKTIFQNEETQMSVLPFLASLQEKYFKLYLIRAFIDAVEIIDY
jgi:hypothetical protein